jgi:hypothetical protein
MSALDQYMEFVSTLGKYYGKALSDDQIEWYAEDLMALSPAELHHAIKVYRTDPANKFFPLPAQLIGIVKPPITELDQANEVANLIVKAVAWPGKTHPEKARIQVGELAWEVVDQLGGWQHLCESMTNENKNTYRAQIRDLAAAVSKRAKRGELGLKPSLPGAIKVAELVNETVKVLEAK